MSESKRKAVGLGAILVLSALASTGTLGCSSRITGCSSAAILSPNVSQHALENRAYVVSKDSDELTVIDLDRREVIGCLATGGVGNHMAELNIDFTKAYVDSPGTNESIVVDLRRLQVTKRIPVAGHPTHITLSRDGNLLGIAAEYANAVSFVDPVRDVEVKRLSGFYTPHFVRWAPDGLYAYVANIGAHHLTKVDVRSLEIAGHIPLDGFQGPPNATEAPEESGFADAQIDHDGILYAAHRSAARVLVYDTRTQTKLTEVPVGPNPWIVYADHPFPAVPVRIVPNWGDMTVSLIDGRTRSVMAVADAADRDSNGVNYSSLAPDKAFVMNRLREDIAVVDTRSGQVASRIPVGGNTETASTTPDGKWIVATVSSADRVVVIDAVTNQVVKTLQNVGRYPWSVTIPRGQNYCH